MRKKISIIVVLLLLSAFADPLDAQYFGRNKPNYESFDFDVHETPNFRVYNYLENPEALQAVANYSENWYLYHQRVLKDTIYSRNPLLIYNDHADFQQTNAISGSIGVGTGGVTEAFKNRVVMPFAMSNQQTHHVLGHELVHAFQYNMILNGDSTSLRNLANLPLWLVEGLAEYMSIGRVDAHTAMWMRDAVLNKDVPTLQDLNNPQYFPYRYGQAFWAFLTGWKGDDVIEPFFTGVAKYGFEAASQAVLGVTAAQLSKMWVDALKSQYEPYLAGREETLPGRAILNREDGGAMNISPQISPNGRYVAFLSERNLFSVDVFLADANKGEIIGTIASTTRDGHIDDLNYIESAGAWSPNSRQFAIVGFSKGDNLLIIKDVESGKTLDEFKIEGVPAFSNPAWSPDGNSIVVSGLVHGQVDLYEVDLSSKRVKQLTNDIYSELHPSFSGDGQTLLFSTDQLAFEKGIRNGKWNYNLASMDMVSGLAEMIDVFPGANNLNPVADTAGNIYFISNRDGYRNLYSYDPSTGQVYQETRILTGISGITHFAPAITIDRRRNRILYTHFHNRTYSIYKAFERELLHEEIDPLEVNLDAATLPTVNPRAPLIVDQLLARPEGPAQTDYLRRVEYKPNFQLDYIGGSAGVGVGLNNTFGTGTGLAGAVQMLFSDILGQNQIAGTVALNGEIQDFGAQVAYLNRKGRIFWGGQISHIPYRSISFNGNFLDSLSIDGTDIPVLNEQFDLIRTFEDRAGLFAQLPFSRTFRLEASVDFTRFSFRVDRFENFYLFDPGTGQVGGLVGQDRNKIDSPDGFNLFSFGGAAVGDNSYFGLTAPLNGHRYRFGVEHFMGEFDFTALTADYRIYRFFRPIGLAFRALHYGRYGPDDDGLFPLFAGSPWYVRGYSEGNVEQLLAQNGTNIDQLFGSKVFISNFEVRIPFTGPKQLSLIGSNFLFTDLNFFVDGGVAFYDFDQFQGDVALLDGEGNPILDFNGDPIIDLLEAEPIFSAGVSLRANLFGALILEPYYTFPLQGKNTSGVFGLNVIPGW